MGLILPKKISLISAQDDTKVKPCQLKWNKSDNTETFLNILFNIFFS